MIYGTSPQPHSVGGYMKNDNCNNSDNGIEDHPEQTCRSSSSIVNHGERFIVKDRNFSRQYAHLYAVRLLEMRKKLFETAGKKWGKKMCI